MPNTVSIFCCIHLILTKFFFFTAIDLLDKIFSLFKQIVSLDYTPDAPLLGLIISQFTSNQFDSEIEEIHTYMEGNFVLLLFFFLFPHFYEAKNIIPTQSCYTIIIKHYAEKRKIEKMVATFNELKKAYRVTPAMYPF